MFRKKIKVKSGHTQSSKDKNSVLESMTEFCSPEIAEKFMKTFPNLNKAHVDTYNIVLYFFEKDPVLFTDDTPHSKAIYPTSIFTIYNVTILQFMQYK